MNRSLLAAWAVHSPRPRDCRRGSPRLARAAAITLLAVAMGLSASGFARATDAPSDPMALVKKLADQAVSMYRDTSKSLPERRRALRALANRNFDFTAMARSALGYHWRTLSEQQRGQFVPLFTAFIQDVYLHRMQSYGEENLQQEVRNAKVQYLRETFDGSADAEVFTTVHLQSRDQPVAVNYLLNRKNGAWWIYDITVESISIVANYRNQFNRVINQHGFDTLMSDLRAKQQNLAALLDKPT